VVDIDIWSRVVPICTVSPPYSTSFIFREAFGLLEFDMEQLEESLLLLGMTFKQSCKLFFICFLPKLQFLPQFLNLLVGTRYRWRIVEYSTGYGTGRFLCIYEDALIYYLHLYWYQGIGFESYITLVLFLLLKVL
jgi:hypothetical protein